MPNIQPGTIRGELAGLRAGIENATTGVFSQTTDQLIPPPTVRDRDITSFYTWTGPALIVVRYAEYRLNVIAGGGLPTMGQPGSRINNLLNYYTVELMNIVPAGSLPKSEAVAAIQDDLIDLVDAITAWFNHQPNRQIPLNGIPMAQRAGIPIVFKGLPPLKSSVTGGVTVALQGLIGVQGVPQPAYPT